RIDFQLVPPRVWKEGAREYAPSRIASLLGSHLDLEIPVAVGSSKLHWSCIVPGQYRFAENIRDSILRSRRVFKEAHQRLLESPLQRRALGPQRYEAGGRVHDYLCGGFIVRGRVSASVSLAYHMIPVDVNKRLLRAHHGVAIPTLQRTKGEFLVRSQRI